MRRGEEMRKEMKRGRGNEEGKKEKIVFREGRKK